MEGSNEPRFEFRSFGQDFQKAFARMARLSVPVPEQLWERSSEELYILSGNTDSNNIKIRDDKLEIKTCIGITDGLERWKPVSNFSFPVSLVELQQQIIPMLSVDGHFLRKTSYTQKEFLELVDLHPSLQCVQVYKKRFAYNVFDTICETGEVLINGACIKTISTESCIREDVRKTIRKVGLEGIENINYIRAIKQVIGMKNKSK